MAEAEIVDRGRKFIPSLEGIRGYAFLLVFLAHYFPKAIVPMHERWLYPVYVLREIAWIAVPMFFVLSGYLICGILFDTREREGYFRVFYSRRILRVFPLYYLTLLVVAAVDHFHGIRLDYHYWAHFFYIQNLLPGYTSHLDLEPMTEIGHLWSLAVEEQFYLVWPLVVWLCRDRRTLLRVTWLLIGASCAARFGAHWLHLSPLRSYFTTPTRGDAILLGSVLALIRREPVYAVLERYAKYVFLAGLALMIWLTVKSGFAWPGGYLRVALLIPAVNVMAAALVVEVMRQGSLACRICSVQWICWLGSLSYGLYVFHLTYRDWFLFHVAPWLSYSMPRGCAFCISAILAFALTLGIGVMSYQLIERPAMELKKRLRYGPAKAKRDAKTALEGVAA